MVLCCFFYFRNGKFIKNVGGNFCTLVCSSLTSRIDKPGTRFPKSALTAGAVVGYLNMTFGQVKVKTFTTHIDHSFM